MAELASFLGVVVNGDPEFVIQGFASLGQAAADDLVFLRDSRHSAALAGSSACAVIVADGIEIGDRAALVSTNPAHDFARLIKEFAPRSRPPVGIALGAQVDATAWVDDTASIGAGAVLGSESQVGAGTVIGANVTLGSRVSIGRDCWIHSGAILREETRLGDRVVLQSGVVLGADGFGYVPDESGRPVAMPQRGCVVIEDDVEIGANTTVDRATLDETRIRRGAKIDNLVQIAHNCDIGEDAIIVAQSGISGGTVVGRGAIIMAQAGATGNLRIGERAFVGARAGLRKDVPDGGRVFGLPATEEHSWHRSVAALKRLPELLRRVRRLEKAGKDPGEGPSEDQSGDGTRSGGDSEPN